MQSFSCLDGSDTDLCENKQILKNAVMSLSIGNNNSLKSHVLPTSSEFVESILHHYTREVGRCMWF